mgnify:CR=1 FL=1|jgi:hypothetical protein
MAEIGLKYKMKKILGLTIIAFGIFLEVMWLGFCFGSIIIGILLLIFAPSVLFFPFSFFLVIGLNVMSGAPNSRSSQFKYQSHSRKNTYSKPQYTLTHYYETLESERTDDFDVIKANYRRLIRQYHYDSIASKDLPADMVKFAEQKTQSLNEAYAVIKEARGK